MSLRTTLTLLGLLLFLLAACTPVTTGDTRTPAPPVPATAQVDATATVVVPEPVTLLQTTLAGTLGLPVAEVRIAGVEAVDWSDTCLGAPRPDEMCAEVITPGYRVVFATPQGRYVIHTDQTGTSYRQVEPALDSTPPPDATVLPILPSREPPVPGASGIEGQVSIGPACPGPVTVDSPCPDQPYQATLTILTTQNERVGQVTTDEVGRFKLSLAPGAYVIRPERPKEGIAYAPETTITVVPGEYLPIKIVYDSGMR